MKFKFILLSTLPTLLFVVFLSVVMLGTKFGVIVPLGVGGAILLLYLYIGLVATQLCFLVGAWFFVRRQGKEHLKKTLGWLSLFLLLLIGYPALGDFFMQGFWFIPVGGGAAFALLYFLFKVRSKRFRSPHV